MKSFLIAAACAVLAPLAAHAHAHAHANPAHAGEAGAGTVGDIAVTGAYARSSNPKVGAVFLTIANNGSQDCALTGVTSDLSDKAELHTHREEQGVMKMVEIDAIPLAAGATHELARGGDHIMLMGTDRPLQDGETVALTLELGDCGSLPLEVPVDNHAGADAGAAHGHGAAGH